MLVTTHKPSFKQHKNSGSLIETYNEAIAVLTPEQIYDRYPHNFKSDATGKLRGIPPFRESKSGTSFTVFPDGGFFDAGDGFAGSPADYIHSMRVGRWERARKADFVAAVRELCELGSIPFPERDPSPSEIEKAVKEETRRAILRETIKICSDLLWSEFGREARQYLITERGLTEQQIKDFNLGYYRKRADLVDYLKHKKFSASEIKGAAVALTSWEGYIIIPWLDENGRVLTLYGRYSQKTAPEGRPKTLALPGISTKRAPLYLDRAIASNHREVIFVEGVFDALLLQALGETRAVSGVAASFSNEQIECLKRNRIEKVYHLGDPDGGGIGGTNSNLMRLTRSGISVYVPPTLPDVLDPDEFVLRKGITALKQLLEQSEHGYRWKAKQIVAEHGNDSDEAIEKIFSIAVAYSRTIPSQYKLEEETFFWATIRNSLGELDPEAFRAKLKARYGDTPSIPTKSGQDLKVPDWAQSSIAKWLAERYRPLLAFNTDIEEWFRYSAINEGIWTKDPKYYIWQIIITELETLADIHEQLHEKKKRPKYGSGFISGIEMLLKAYLPVRGWDEQPGLLPFINGVKNLTTGEFVPHAPGFRLTWCLPYEYSPGATCEPILDWLHSMTNGDEAIIEFIRAHLNAIITGRSDIQSYLELIGPGGTGKGTLTRLASALTGDRNTVSTTLRNLEENRFDTSRLYQARLVIITDAEKWGGDVSVLKAITGGDKLRFEQKFKQPLDGFYYKGRVMICANEPIQSADYTSGLERRRQTVYMTNKIPLKSQRKLIELSNSGVEGEFVPYLPGLMNWVLDMSPTDVERIIRETPTAHHQFQYYKAQILTETNPIADWLDTSVVVRPDYRTAIGVASRDKSSESPNWYLNTDRWLYANYAEYCHGSGAKPVSVRRFVNLLHDLAVNQLNLKVTKGRDRMGSYVLGLKLRSPDDDDPLIISGSIPNDPPSRPDKPLGGSPNPGCDGNVIDGGDAQTPSSDGYDECDGKFEGLDSLDKNEIKKVKNEKKGTLGKSDSVQSSPSPKTSQRLTGDGNKPPVSNNVARDGSQEEKSSKSPASDGSQETNKRESGETSQSKNPKITPAPKYEIGDRVDRYNSVHECWHTNVAVKGRYFKGIEWVYVLDDCWQSRIFERYLRPAQTVNSKQ
ncbi:phage/plasmid primase, P4 family (plasmid) [Gloeothece citriformis PCC 7424]|uniref:Phage/plasmid primase, P4 family n=1 Tax=Gloeothece citriformis (strain PCC 7424) TaxID=65393 RepID=B7KLN2_GLOC7|nr:phage/plasmid primase, P4 family [Gloeothece citriformis]ACK73704.1 phage/plasmid primase, P4 family [Gloeothece citriformis PCC 7424]